MNVRLLGAGLALTAALLASGCSCGSLCHRPAAPAPCATCAPSGVPGSVPAPVPAFSSPQPVNGFGHP
jgi:hypothetical protein